MESWGIFCSYAFFHSTSYHYTRIWFLHRFKLRDVTGNNVDYKWNFGGFSEVVHFFIALRASPFDFGFYIGLMDVSGNNVDYKWNLVGFSVVVHFFYSTLCRPVDFGFFIGLRDVTGNNVDCKWNLLGFSVVVHFFL